MEEAVTEHTWWGGSAFLERRPEHRGSVLLQRRFWSCWAPSLSFCCSHSIFSIRILRVEDGEPPPVHAVSALCLCHLAGSERSSRTQNKGEDLKEAGNINASLLILGKCIKALQHNQHTRLLQHVPLRESKLTHYLQGFFCSSSKACMVVNVSQCASMYHETLNVLKLLSLKF
ncbi:kinesin-like protein KIF20B [Fundulus heteroclitus]|uniref:kinesin-like protein KIF20B n=1 Tax=Fundulus heteroclitus TaxID=8078 RepID=UPI00165CB798|nr:kinesin-like protein KIF20B [Fundulus heteroclitus]